MSNKKTKSRRIRVKKAVTIVCVLILALLAISAVHNFSKDQKARTRLNNSSVILDRSLKLLENEASNSADIHRVATCNRETTKFSDGWIVCGQELILSGKAESNEEIMNKIESFVKATNSQTQFVAINTAKVGRQQLTDSMFLDSQKVHSRDSYLPTCVATFMIYPLGYRVLEDQGKYEMKLSCTEKGLGKDIY